MAMKAGVRSQKSGVRRKPRSRLHHLPQEQFSRGGVLPYYPPQLQIFGAYCKSAARSLTVAALLLASGFWLLTPAWGQFIGFTAPQTVGPITCINAASAPATSSSTPGAASFIPNLGQSVHYVAYTTSGTVNSLSIQIDGSFDNTTFFRLSDPATNVTSGAVFSNIFIPFMRCNLTAISGGGSLTARYTGTSTSAGPPVGIFAASSFTKNLALNANGGASASYTVLLPIGHSGGILYFTPTGGGIAAGGRLDVVVGVDGSHEITAMSAPLETLGTQRFLVPSIPGLQARVSYVNGGPGGTYDLIYAFGQMQSNNVLLAPRGESLFECTRRANISFTAAGNTEIIPVAPTGLATRICHLSVSVSAATNLSIHQGQGANCATGDIAITGTYQSVTSPLVLLFSNFSPLRSTTSNQAICVNSSAVVTGGGVVIYDLTELLGP